MNRSTITLSILALLGLLFASTYLVNNEQVYSHTLITRDQTQIYLSFSQWTEKQGKRYRQEQQRSYRFLKFKQNYKFVNQHNARYAKGLQTFNVTLNKFADLDLVEFSSLYLMKKKSTQGKLKITTECKTKLAIKTDIPESWDWLDHQAVGPVRNQGNCGSCWAFSAIGAIQGINAIKNNKIQTFSPQQLVDCAGGKYGNQGCNGGQMDAAMWYVTDNGISLQSKYPYNARTNKCVYKPQTMKAYTISDCAQIQANKSSALKSAVYTQPVSISIDANSMAFQFYNHGVFTGKCGTDLDHGIVLTGYGNLGGVDFWKCRNSWGSTWGVNGYIMMGRSNADGPGQCGILMENTVPIA